jgi:hypothetical protein
MTEAVLAIIKITIRQEATINADPAKETKFLQVLLIRPVMKFTIKRSALLFV